MTVVVDGAVDLPPEALAWADVRTVPAHVLVGGEPFDGLPAALWEALRGGRSVATTAPTVSELADAFGQGTPIVAVHVSGELSLTVVRAREAAERVPGPVTVVDSGSLSVGAGLAAVEARRIQATATSYEEAGHLLRELPGRVHTLAVVADPAWLVRSGRGGIVPGRVSTRHPVILAVHGRPVVLEQPKDRRAVVRHLARRIHDHGLAAATDWALGHADAADVDAVAEVLAGTFGRPPAFVVPVDVTVGVHLGPDALVVGVLR